MAKNRPTADLISARREAHLRTVQALSLLLYIAHRAPHELAAWPWLRHWVAEATSHRIPSWFTSNPRLAALAQATRFLRVPLVDLCVGLERPLHPQPHIPEFNDALLGDRPEEVYRSWYGRNRVKLRQYSLAREVDK